MGERVNITQVPKRNGARNFLAETEAIFADMQPDADFIKAMTKKDGYKIHNVCPIVMESDRKAISKLRRLVVTCLERLEIDPDLYTIRTIREDAKQVKADGKEQVELVNWSVFLSLRSKKANDVEPVEEAEAEVVSGNFAEPATG